MEIFNAFAPFFVSDISFHFILFGQLVKVQNELFLSKSKWILSEFRDVIKNSIFFDESEKKRTVFSENLRNFLKFHRILMEYFIFR